MYPLHLQTWGNPSRPPLVLLHGFMGSAQDWQNLAAHLQTQFYCLAVDWPGHGKTPLQAAPSISYASWNAALLKTLRAIGLEEVLLLGYSMGGRLALDFAWRYPQHVRRLITLSANPGLDETAARRQRAAWDSANAQRIRQDGLPAFLQDWYNLPLFASLERVPGLKDRLRARRGQQNPQAMAQIIEALSPGHQPSLWPRLPALKIPVLALCGQLDAKYIRITERMAASNPRIRARIVPEAGHAVHLEQPQKLEKILITT